MILSFYGYEFRVVVVGFGEAFAAPHRDYRVACAVEDSHGASEGCGSAVDIK